ncbi:hypothetical protein BUY96_12520 [Staphylococcus gallinarum]|nr:hypothetical protein BUY96_12520 [Staphylococcus gallinarum]
MKLYYKRSSQMDIKTLEQYIDKYSQISQSMMNSMYVIQKDAFANSPITSDQFNLMNAINSREDCTSSLLAKEFNVKKSSITAIVSRLVDKGYIERIYNKKDRRVVFIKLTKYGHELLNTKRNELINTLMPIGHGFDGKDWDKVIESSTTLATQLTFI